MKRALFATAVVMMAASCSIAAPSSIATQECSWGGTAAAPTGVVKLTPGLTLTPSASATSFEATGSLAGGGRCRGTMTFIGTIRAGSTCAQQWFDGRVKGLRGVARFSGPGGLGVVHEFLYDQQGNVVGADQPVLQVPQPDGYSHAQDCATPQGFTKAVFSSTVELWS